MMKQEGTKILHVGVGKAAYKLRRGVGEATGPL